MKRLLTILGGIAIWSASAALASDAATSATAGADRRSPNGVAAASARYEGDIGFARSESRSGPLNLARGVAVGLDEDGLTLSVSNAIAPRLGPAIATNFNLSIGSDGQVSASHGIAVAEGPLHRSASAGGAASSQEGAISTASGKSDRFGRVIARTEARDRRSILTPRPIRGRH